MSATAPTPRESASAPEDAKSNNFIRHIVEGDMQSGAYSGRHWGGSPGDAAHHQSGAPDAARIRTRFPPEPNGYLHIGHAKSMWLNFSLAAEYGGVCHLRFDDTNPEKEEQEYIDSIREAVRWMGFSHEFADSAAHPDAAQPHEYFASNYFDFMHRAAVYLIEAGLAYVDEQTPEQMRENRGDFTTP
ncbi:MAG: glutamine--tRNA ligase, partial [Ottowia sp.]|nr:glutamine--tRNA ligase [Ottowia sp.]